MHAASLVPVTEPSGPTPDASRARGSDAAPAPAGTSRSARRQFASTILVLEAFVVGFGALVAHGLQVAPATVVWGVGGALALALVLVAGMLRWPGGYVAGSALQVALVLTGLGVPTMFVVGAIFVVLWVVALRLGGRIDRERRERSAQADGVRPIG